MAMGTDAAEPASKVSLSARSDGATFTARTARRSGGCSRNYSSLHIHYQVFASSLLDRPLTPRLAGADPDAIQA